MDAAKKAALEAAGVRFTTVAEFLGLTEDERQLVEFRVWVARQIRANREARGLSQKEAGKAMKTTQPRFAKIEAGASDVSLDQMLRGYFVTGGSGDALVAQVSGKPAAPRRRRAMATNRGRS